MADDPLRYVQPSEPFHVEASTWNAFVDAARENRRLKIGGGGNYSGRPFPGAILAKNSSGADRARGDCVPLSFPLVSRSTNDATFKAQALGIMGSAVAYNWSMGILAEGVLSGKMGWVYVEGIVPGKLDIGDTDDEFCDTPASGFAAKTGMVGQAKILWKDSGTGSSDKWGVIELAAASTIVLDGKLTTTLAANGSGTFEAYVQTSSGGIGTASGSTGPVIDSGFLSSGTILPVGTPCRVVWTRGEAFSRLEGFNCDSI